MLVQLRRKPQGKHPAYRGMISLWSRLRGASARKGNLRGLKQRLILSIEKQPSAQVDYLEFFDEKTMQPVKPKKGARMALAVFIGKTRLIDNARL